MRCAYHPDYFVPLPTSHPFPMAKYPLLYEQLLGEGGVATGDILVPDEARLPDLALVHTADYLERLEAGSLDAAEIRRIGVPWSAALWRRSRLAVQGTIEASLAALSDGLAGNLAGGTHHAFPDHGEGFCVLNDVAVAIRVLQRDRRVATALVVDLDVHQGNGTAAIFEGDPAVFTFSMHGERNYPARKMQSRVDVGLRDGMEDEEYLHLLAMHLEAILGGFTPDIVYYLAGVDPARGDRYGRLKLSDDGIRRRDRLVLDACLGRGLPTVITMAGGYASTPARTAELHAIVFREAAKKAIIAPSGSITTAGSRPIRPARE
ncbi:MAG: histone deacetylase [Gammaproteobacteria bacterium]|nr:histone deacetylase [Gammaproteobacteria bacterium]